MLIWLWTMETFASSVSCWLANREGESTNMWNCKKGKFYYLEQILKTTETGKVLTCESERSKQLKSESFTLVTDQYKNIPISSVTTVSSNHADIYSDLLLGNPNRVAGKKKGSLKGIFLIPPASHFDNCSCTIPRFLQWWQGQGYSPSPLSGEDPALDFQRRTFSQCQSEPWSQIEKEWHFWVQKRHPLPFPRGENNAYQEPNHQRSW